ncbi:HIG1 domain family member 1C [Habropoda laboriosa]|uniref:HIG1 domain family member 1C n=1 Tax=Habropoda laboriosa TaxID=597456 RepID=A0A0L7RKB6_9HYME|nr:PREDICTED: HIG1 domain family member 1A, mitochondrial-like [Habropoda laboriosa]KOC71186.1 HIG1 domain family member 1C [Habropoda laboriosa]
MNPPAWANNKSIDIPEEAIRQSLESQESFDSQGFSLSKQSPFLLVGLAGLVAVCGIGAFKWKTMKKTMSPSMYLMQLRVTAQSTVLGCLALGMIYHMYQDFVLKKK